MEQYLIDYIQRMRGKLDAEAERLKPGRYGEFQEEWQNAELWKHYFSRANAELYQSYSDTELLEMLCNAASELGREPSQKDVFCVYRVYIRKRFRNWPRALVAAGLRQPKKHPAGKQA